MVNYGPPPEALVKIESILKAPEIHRYGPVAGTNRLIELIEQKLAMENGINAGQGSKIVVTAGANMAFASAILATCRPGDEVIMQVPCFFNQETAVRIAGCVPVFTNTTDSFHIDIVGIRNAITPKTRAIVTISPNNPSGAVYSTQDLTAVNLLCGELGLYHIHDEAYEYFTYDGNKHFSPGSLKHASRYTISIYSLSKSYALAGWRVGWMVIPSEIERDICGIQDVNLICPPLISQQLAIHAMTVGSSYPKARLGELRDIHDICKRAIMTVHGCCVTSGEGAIYLIINLNTQHEPMEVVRYLIRKHRVALLPGHVFRLAGCQLRMSYSASSRREIELALERLVTGLKELTHG